MFKGGNMNKAMKQMKKMQSDMAKMQDELKDKTVEATAGGGVVKVVANGHKEVKDIEIKPEAVDPDDVEMLQDLVLAAVNEALKNADDLAEKEMQKVTGGLQLPPGMF
ncbi:YbaB/EbfC family nucleoid-associated protein [Proteinivorax tanatarense]|uniref:Nucleoid-associated protein PRVXT_000032 n=1 Tax=Proteinivorax tanatarense TaxID=1260629 RepID=A0AAU7VLK9_9FIRM